MVSRTLANRLLLNQNVESQLRWVCIIRKLKQQKKLNWIISQQSIHFSGYLLIFFWNQVAKLYYVIITVYRYPILKKIKINLIVTYDTFIYFLIFYFSEFFEFFFFHALFLFVLCPSLILPLPLTILYFRFLDNQVGFSKFKIYHVLCLKNFLVIKHVVDCCSLNFQGFEVLLLFS